MISKRILQLAIVLYITFLISFSVSQEETTIAPTTKGQEEEDEPEPEKKGCSIWCWIQKIAMFVISQLLSAILEAVFGLLYPFGDKFIFLTNSCILRGIKASTLWKNALSSLVRTTPRTLSTSSVMQSNMDSKLIN